MQKVTILGREFPLFLSVSALEQIKDRMGGVEETAEALKAEENTLETLDKSITLLAILAKEGAVAHRFENPDAPVIIPPDEQLLHSLISIADLNRITSPLIEALNDGVGRTVFSMPDEENEKNSAGAQ